jgi:hypothetical protein
MQKPTQSGISQPRILGSVIFVLDLPGAVRVSAILESRLWRLLPVPSLSKWAWTIPAFWFEFVALTSSVPIRANSVLVKQESLFSGEGCAAAATRCREFFVAFSAIDPCGCILRSCSARVPYPTSSDVSDRLQRSQEPIL